MLICKKIRWDFCEHAYFALFTSSNKQQDYYLGMNMSFSAKPVDLQLIRLGNNTFYGKY